MTILSLVLLVLALAARATGATSSQAYQDYLYQFEVYRQKYSDFQVAKNEYEKFKSLASQTAALEKTKIMLSQRDQLLRAYLFLLNERLNEDQGLNVPEKQQYQTLIKNEVTFLDGHSALVPSIGSLPDAVKVSEELQSHYNVLSRSMRQTIVAISLGQLSVLSKQYDTALQKAQDIITNRRVVFSPQKQANLDRWLLQIQNKRSLYQQKINAVSSANTTMKPGDVALLDRQFTRLMADLSESKQYMVEGAAFMEELVNSLRYQD